MKPDGILETALYVDNLEEAEEFYKNIIGLELKAKAADRHLFFQCGPGMLLIFNPKTTSVKTGPVPAHGATGSGHVAFKIPDTDFDKWRDHFKNHSIEIEAEIDWPEGSQSIYLRDPAGNSLELTTPKTWNL